MSKANETVDDAATEVKPLVSPVAHPDFRTACEAVSNLSQKLSEVQKEAGPLRAAHGIKTVDPRRAVALRSVGRGAEADAHERLADLDAHAAVYTEAVERAVKTRDAVKARLEKELSDDAYKTRFVPAAREAVTAFFALSKAWDHAREVREELDGYGLASPRLRQAAATFTDSTLAAKAAKPGPSGIDQFRRLLLSWVDAGILDFDEARQAFPADTKFV